MINKIHQMDCLEGMKKIPDNSIDSCVTDPPYGLSKEPDIREVLEKWLAGEDYTHRGGGFMGKSWDSFVPGPSVWREVYRVLKPGGHALVFAGTRTQDLMTISLRLAGFEIRDVIEWLYFSGFPKSMDVGKAFDKRAGAEREIVGEKITGKARVRLERRNANEGFETGQMKIPVTAPATPLAKKWDGWGTSLKPAHEPIILVRKPLEGTVAENVEKWGTGALNIGACRIPTEGEDKEKHLREWQRRQSVSMNSEEKNCYGKYGDIDLTSYAKDGRFPANCVTLEDDQFYSKYFNITPPELSKKASKRDRNSDWRGEEISLPERESKKFDGERFTRNGDGLPRKQNGGILRNTHPTVKPIDLMAWLVRLVTPPNGTVLDPFAGSGSTLVAAKREGFNFIGFELEKEYVEIAEARISGGPEQKALFYFA